MPSREEVLQNLVAPSRPLSADSTCSICYEDLNDPVQLPCQSGHVFCRECVTNWLETPGNNTCPYDRERLFEDELEVESEDDEEDYEQELAQRQWQFEVWSTVRLYTMALTALNVSWSLEDCPSSDLHDEVEAKINELEDAIREAKAARPSNAIEFSASCINIQHEIDEVFALIDRASADVHGSTYQQVRNSMTRLTTDITEAQALAPHIPGE